MRRVGLIDLFLPALGREGLAEVAVGVQHADTDEWHTEVRSGFEVVAGEYTQATGVDRKRLVYAELH